ncbi:DHHW family protein [Brassicibacter mesophilus]|uniref:DHHW family protein n=1 Tax=Brassicibacter mesophilus TaxID=745119 RepID=UPI003D1AB552
MNKKKAKYIVIPFLVIIFGFFLMNILCPDKKFSITENRNLAKKPTVEDIVNSTYASKFEKYYTDQFVFREKMICFNRMSEMKLNKSMVGNYYLGEDNWILGMFPKILTPDNIDNYSDAINSLSQLSQGMGKDVYFTLTPHKTNMLKHLYPKYVDNMNNININKDNFKSNLNSNFIIFLDIDEYMLSKFSEKERERLYFKTDHHWNGVGAFEGFKLMAQKMELGVSSEKLEDHFSKYKTKVCSDKNFIGSYNRNIDMLVKEREYLSYIYLEGGKYEYFLNNGKKDEKVKEEDVIATLRNKDKWDYGGAYIRGAQCNMLKIRNKNSLTDKKILVFRDSYQAPTTLLLADLFNEVQLVDPRNIGNIEMSYEQIIQSTDADIVMFMYNSSGFDSMIKSMIDKGIK